MAFDWPEPLRVNPHLATLAEPLRKAAADLGVPDMDRIRIDLLAAYAFPDAHEEGLRLAAMWFLWYLAYDDAIDTGQLPQGWTGERLASRAALIVGGRKNDCLPTLPVLTMLEALIDVTLQGMSEEWGRKYRVELGFYVDACRTTLAWHMVPEYVPPVDKYLAHRRATSAVFPCLLLAERCAGFETPSASRTPALRRLEELSNDLAAWTNDLHGWRRETHAGDSFVRCLMGHGDSEGEAENKVRVVMQLGIREFAAIASTLTDPHALRYARVILSFAQGNDAWYADTDRYPGDVNRGRK
jgi:Terpene synthase family 2, C-terminal metal binding